MLKRGREGLSEGERERGETKKETKTEWVRAHSKPSHASSTPEVQPGQGGGATPQVPARPHSQLYPTEQQLRLSAGADGAALVAAVEGREGRDPFQRIGDGGPTAGPYAVAPAM